MANLGLKPWSVDSRYFLNQYCILPCPWPLLRTSDGLANTPASDGWEDLQCPTPVLASSIGATASRAVFLLPTAGGVIDPEPMAALNHLLKSSAPTQGWYRLPSQSPGSWQGPGRAEPGLYKLYYMQCALILYFLILLYSALSYPILCWSWTNGLDLWFENFWSRG